MSFFDGKIAVVSGSSYGIGRAIAVHLANLGCKVGILARLKKN